MSWRAALFERVWAMAQGPLALLFVVFAVDLVYYFAPNADSRWVWISPGSLVATGLWLARSAASSCCCWLYLSAILVGAELNAEIDQALPGARHRARRCPGSGS